MSFLNINLKWGKGLKQSIRKHFKKLLVRELYIVFERAILEPNWRGYESCINRPEDILCADYEKAISAIGF